MRAALLMFTCLALVSVAPLAAPAPDPVTAAAQWLVDLQFGPDAPPEARGAIPVHGDAGAYHLGSAYVRVVPYDAHRAVIGLLQSEHPARFSAAEAWFTWAFAHRVDSPGSPLDGVTFDHWYAQDGSGESVCVTAPGPQGCLYRDADDAYAATLLQALWVYARTGGAQAAAFLATPSARDAIAAAVDLMHRTTGANGLTWARLDYPLAYTMDNSEVVCGYRAASALARDTYGDLGAAAARAADAEAVQAAMFTHLISADDLWRVWTTDTGVAGGADFTSWYPGTTPIMWPLLHGVTDPRGVHAAHQFAAVNAAFPTWPDEAVDADGFTWPSIGVAARLTGDDDRADRHRAFVATKAPAFAYPWSAGDAGWFLVAHAAAPLVCP